jgi:hypothetical protein
VYIFAVPGIRAEEASATTAVAELAAAVSALQIQLVGVQSRMREGEVQNESLRETIVNLTYENQLLKRRIYGNKPERTQTSELQLSLGKLLDAEKQLQKQLDQAVAQAKADGNAENGGAPQSEKTKPKPTGRRDLSASHLPRFLLEIFDEELEKTANRIGFDEGLHLMYRRGGYSVLVKRTAKYEVRGKHGPTVLGVKAPKTLSRAACCTPRWSLTSSCKNSRWAFCTTAWSNICKTKASSSVVAPGVATSRKPATHSARPSGTPCGKTPSKTARSSRPTPRRP